MSHVSSFCHSWWHVARMPVRPNRRHTYRSSGGGCWEELSERAYVHACMHACMVKTHSQIRRHEARIRGAQHRYSGTRNLNLQLAGKANLVTRAPFWLF
jgi:hypothetical protein